MKKISMRTYFIMLLCLPLFSMAQQAKHKVVLITPLYLDSVFDAGNNYLPDKSFPKFLNPGLEFYEGARLAIDSMDSRQMPLEVFIVDSKGPESVNQKLSKPELKNVELIIGQTNLQETKELALEAFKRKIPFISATLPNDAGVNNNPYFVMLNSTLQAHAEGIYHFIQKYHPLDHIIVFRKPGAQEDKIRENLTEVSRSSVASAKAIRYIDIGNNFTAQQLSGYLDSTHKNVCIAGSLDEAFGVQLARQLASISKKYPITLLGMPTWDNINFSKPEFGNLEIIYSAPFFYSRSTPLETELAAAFTNNIGSRPTDLFFKGYETMLRFASLLVENPRDFSSNISRKGSTVFTPFDIQPVFRDKKNMTLDYFENKHLYFIRVIAGIKNVLY